MQREREREREKAREQKNENIMKIERNEICGLLNLFPSSYDVYLYIIII